MRTESKKVCRCWGLLYNKFTIVVTSLSYMYLSDQWTSAPGPHAEHAIRMKYLSEDIDRILSIYTEDLVTKQTYFIVLCQWDCLIKLLYQVACILGLRSVEAIHSHYKTVKFLQIHTIHTTYIVAHPRAYNVLILNRYRPTVAGLFHRQGLAKSSSGLGHELVITST